MDAELCRRLARAKGTAWWRYYENSDATFADRMMEFCLKTKTIAAVVAQNPAVLEFFDWCDRSLEITQQLGISVVSSSNLQTIVDEIFTEMTGKTEIEVEEKP